MNWKRIKMGKWNFTWLEYSEECEVQRNEYELN